MTVLFVIVDTSAFFLCLVFSCLWHCHLWEGPGFAVVLVLCTTCVWWIWMVFRRNSCLVVHRNESLSSRGWWTCGFVVCPFLGKPFLPMLRACFFRRG